jgi:pimeloyl-ACP methyl ester carboxylesterase
MSEPTAHKLEVPGAVLTYDVHEADTAADHRPLFIVGSPMGASGFAQLVAHFADRTVITYDPRGMERSELLEGGKVTVEVHGDDLHRVVAASGLGSVDVFASSGGAMVALPWILAYPDEVVTLVAHEPPLVGLLEDAAIASKVYADIIATYQRDGYGPAMARFIKLVMHVGTLSDDYLDEPPPDPTHFGLPTEDDGSRDDLLLAGNLTMPTYHPDPDALQDTGVRIVPAIGAEGEGTLARRGGEAFAALLGVEPVVFPGDHGGFTASEWSPNNDPAAFASKLRTVLDG